ncbi:PAM68 family protein [Roseofilum capinflatum]|uniref:PAM68 family protein n=1 Tax=Roseofilum capinflatum BLCC-M114 TaxID=3022440 RepID=A0ABT7B716_9CYAN|nr:PAM68 family protein [Roseofilum capinflatum]MDJ1174926.1 PAM68 family protein [Roseofilum capinflatum BLCC-M114]
MSPEPDQKGGSASKERLPFEPKTSRKKNSPTPSSSSAKEPKSSKGSKKRTPIRKEDRVIPDAVSKRMIRRMALLSGIPTALGVLTFAASYWILTQTEFDLPHIAVVLVSMGFFGLGVLGLSYGVLSASWDENRVGTLLGWQDFTQNLGRTIAAWRSVKQD